VTQDGHQNESTHVPAYTSATPAFYLTDYPLQNSLPRVLYRLEVRRSTPPLHIPHDAVTPTWRLAAFDQVPRG
jgi:hypothetical protein